MAEMLYVTDRNAWRQWLQDHHDTETEIWLIIYKKHTGQPSIPYDDAVEEALCFGWVDSIVKRLDDKKYAQKYTPRRLGSNWSASNRLRVRKLIEDGRMTSAGLATIDPAVLRGEPAPEPPPLEMPAFVKRALRASPTAWKNFTQLAPSHRRNYLRWILDAKKSETQARRLKEAVALLEKNQKLGMK
jgi:uncharacterized protein YdeI (YjbR/CyaY-like superfamily)